MGKLKRDSVILVSSSDDDDGKDSGRLLKNGFRFSKSAPSRKNPKRSKSVSMSRSCSRPLEPSFSNFDEVKKFAEEFDNGLCQFKGSRSNKDQWVEKYKPSCLDELAVHKKKVEEVKLWFEERLSDSMVSSSSNVILISGQAGVGKSATIYAIASHLGAEVLDWNAPTPTIWQEHLHNSNSGMRYTSKLDEFESFVEKTRKYGLVSSSLTQVSLSSVILLIDDLPVVNGKNACERLKKCLQLLLQSVRLPTAILINDYSRSESVDNYSHNWEELKLFLQNAGAFKVALNPVTVNSIKRVLSKICRAERIEVNDVKIDDIAKASGGDIRNAVTSLQYYCLKLHPVQSSSLLKSLPSCPERKMNASDGFSIPFGKDATLSLFHALGKFLHNKRESCNITPDVDGYAILLKEKFVRCPLKMDDPELVLCQAHGQARPIADFLHENVFDFVNEEAIEDAWIVSTYLSDSDLLLSSTRGSLIRNFEAENVAQSIAASIVVRGLLFGNSHPVSRWHAIRRPVLWQVEQSVRHNKCQILSERINVQTGRSLKSFSALSSEFKPAFNLLGYRASEVHDIEYEVDFVDDGCDCMSLDGNDVETETDEIEDW